MASFGCSRRALAPVSRGRSHPNRTQIPGIIERMGRRRNVEESVWCLTAMADGANRRREASWSE